MFKIIRKKITTESDFTDFEKEVDRLTTDGFSIMWWICNIWSTICIWMQKKIRVVKEDIENDPDTPDALKKCKSSWNQFEFIWNRPWLRKITKITSNTKKAWDKLVKEFKDMSLIEASISNYIEEIEWRSPKSDYYHHRFTFEEFLSQGNWARKFINY